MSKRVQVFIDGEPEDVYYKQADAIHYARILSVIFNCRYHVFSMKAGISRFWRVHPINPDMARWRPNEISDLMD